MVAQLGGEQCRLLRPEADWLSHFLGREAASCSVGRCSGPTQARLREALPGCLSGKSSLLPRALLPGKMVLKAEEEDGESVPAGVEWVSVSLLVVQESWPRLPASGEWHRAAL